MSNIVINKCPSSKDININVGSAGSDVSISQGQEASVSTNLSCQFSQSSGTSSNPNVNVFAGVYRGLLDIYATRSGIVPGSITFYDEETLLGQSSEVQFLGIDVHAVKRNGRICVYIPPVDLASSFNSSDGSTDATISSTSVSSRFLSNPLGNVFSIGNLHSGDSVGATNSSQISFSTSDYFSIDSSTGTYLFSRVENGDGNLIFNDISYLTGDSQHIFGNTKVNITGFSEDSYKYKAKFSSIIDLQSLLPSGGLFSVYFTYSGTNTSSFSQTGIFYDTNANTINSSSPVVTSGIFASNKKISGIKYLTTGDSFNFYVSGINNLNYLTFLNPLGAIEPNTSFGISNFNLTPYNLSNWDANYNNSGSNFSGQKSISRTSYRYFGYLNGLSSVGCRFYDWINISYQYSSGLNLLIDTYGDSSSDYYEPFDGENYRTVSGSGDWNSNSLLSSNDLFVHNGKLQRQFGEWTGYIPYNNAVYTGNNSTQYYFRGFKKDSVTKTNGTFYINGVTETNLSNNHVILWISLDANNWYNCNLPWGGGSLNNGDGCRINTDSKPIPQLEFTLAGQFTTEASGPDGWGIYCKVEMPSGSNVAIDTLEITNWT